jgi:hypothetical protein
LHRKPTTVSQTALTSQGDFQTVLPRLGRPDLPILGKRTDYENLAGPVSRIAGSRHGHPVLARPNGSQRSKIGLNVLSPLTSIVFHPAIGGAAMKMGQTIAAGVGRGLANLGQGLGFAAELAGSSSKEGSTAQAATRASDQMVSILAGQIAHLRARIERALATAGVMLTEPVDLVPDGRGGIAVAGWHPQQTAIEAALSHDFLLERDFTEIARQFESADGTADGRTTSFVLHIRPFGEGDLQTSDPRRVIAN